MPSTRRSCSPRARREHSFPHALPVPLRHTHHRVRPGWQRRCHLCPLRRPLPRRHLGRPCPGPLPAGESPQKRHGRASPIRPRPPGLLMILRHLPGACQVCDRTRRGAMYLDGSQGLGSVEWDVFLRGPSFAATPGVTARSVGGAAKGRVGASSSRRQVHAHRPAPPLARR